MISPLKDMESLIRRSFSRIESMHSLVCRGEYDILSPTGEIILPDVWSTVLKGGWVVELRFSAPIETEQGQDQLSASESVIVPPIRACPSLNREPQSRTLPGTQSVNIKQRYSVGTWLAKRRTASNIATK